MPIQAFRLTFVLRVPGTDTGTIQQTTTIATETVDEAVELAQFYWAGLPSESLCSATLADVTGAVIWSQRTNSTPDVMPLQKDQS